MVDVPWVLWENQRFRYRILAAPWIEHTGVFNRSDAGMGATWTAPGRVLQVTALGTAGEGANQRERNAGQSVSLYVKARPRSSQDLELDLVLRQGSVGLQSARDHRAGFRVSYVNPSFGCGGSTLRAWGVAGDPSREPWVISGWATATPGSQVLVVLRGSQLIEAQGGHSTELLLAAGLAPRDSVWSAMATGQTFNATGTASAAPGVSSEHWVLGVQVSAQVRGVVPLNSMSLE